MDTYGGYEDRYSASIAGAEAVLGESEAMQCSYELCQEAKQAHSVDTLGNLYCSQECIKKAGAVRGSSVREQMAKSQRSCVGWVETVGDKWLLRPSLAGCVMSGESEQFESESGAMLAAGRLMGSLLSTMSRMGLSIRGSAIGLSQAHKETKAEKVKKLRKAHAEFVQWRDSKRETAPQPKKPSTAA